MLTTWLMSQVRLKVCGITSLEDALAAIESGADYLGFNFYGKSARYITPAAAQAIVAEIADRTVPVGIFVDEESPQKVIAMMIESGVRMAQLHGHEDAAFCAELGSDRVIKVLRPDADFDPSSAMEYPAAAILVDASDEKLLGGTGRIANWEIARQVAQLRPVFLAGGLGPDNIRDAIAKVAPFAVDVNSGVESAPGRKDREKLRQLRMEMER